MYVYIQLFKYLYYYVFNVAFMNILEISENYFTRN